MVKINYISIAKKAAAIQISELKKINKVFNKSFIQAVNLLANCKGKVICAGIGKSGLIARKVSATLSSVGISSFFLNPSEANHGDLGQIDKRDLLLVFSYSGNTSEIANMLRYANRFNIKIIGVAAKKDNSGVGIEQKDKQQNMRQRRLKTHACNRQKDKQQKVKA